MNNPKIKKGTVLIPKSGNFEMLIKSVFTKENQFFCKIEFHTKTDDCYDDIPQFRNYYSDYNYDFLVSELLKVSKFKRKKNEK